MADPQTPFITCKEAEHLAVVPPFVPLHSQEGEVVEVGKAGREPVPCEQAVLDPQDVSVAGMTAEAVPQEPLTAVRQVVPERVPPEGQEYV